LVTIAEALRTAYKASTRSRSPANSVRPRPTPTLGTWPRLQCHAVARACLRPWSKTRKAGGRSVYERQPAGSQHDVRGVHPCGSRPHWRVWDPGQRVRLRSLVRRGPRALL